MRWMPWGRRPDDQAAAERGRELEARTLAAQEDALRAIAEADRAKARAHRLIRENRLAPKIAAALREPQ